MGFHDVGIVGLTNMSVLFAITVWKTISLISSSGDYIMTDHNCRKSLLFQLLLLLSVASDIPMYIAFVATSEYTLVTYSFHKFSSAFLFAAYSMTIYDWSSVLYDIKEIDHRPLFFRRNSLILVTFLMFMMSSLNFVYMYTTSGVDAYINSPFYVANIFLQVAASLFLTGMMLSAGLRLSIRIKGVCGELKDSIHLPSHVTTKTSSVRGLQSAVNRLNTVMFICFSCIFIQALLLMLNYALGYSNRTGKTVGPLYFYWTFYFWLPVWGPVLSLMYLGRSSFHKRDVLSDIDTLSPLNFDASYGASGRNTMSVRKTASAGNMSGQSAEDISPRATVYRPPDYPSALFSRDSAYQYDEDGLDHESDTNGSFDALMTGKIASSGPNVLAHGQSTTIADFYDAYLLGSPEHPHHVYPNVSVDGTATSGDNSGNFPVHSSDRSASKATSYTTESDAVRSSRLSRG